jgi:hypothetical protein
MAMAMALRRLSSSLTNPFVLLFDPLHVTCLLCPVKLLMRRKDLVSLGQNSLTHVYVFSFSLRVSPEHLPETSSNSIDLRGSSIISLYLFNGLEPIAVELAIVAPKTLAAEAPMLQLNSQFMGYGLTITMVRGLHVVIDLTLKRRRFQR